MVQKYFQNHKKRITVNHKAIDKWSFSDSSHKHWSFNDKKEIGLFKSFFVLFKDFFH